MEAMGGICNSVNNKNKTKKKNPPAQEADVFEFQLHLLEAVYPWEIYFFVLHFIHL